MKLITIKGIHRKELTAPTLIHKVLRRIKRLLNVNALKSDGENCPALQRLLLRGL